MQELHYSGKSLYSTLFRDGAWVTCRGACAAAAGSLALRIRDEQRGDRLAVIERIVPA